MGSAYQGQHMPCLKMSSLLLITYHFEIIFRIYGSDYQATLLHHHWKAHQPWSCGETLEPIICHMKGEEGAYSGCMALGIRGDCFHLNDRIHKETVQGINNHYN